MSPPRHAIVKVMTAAPDIPDLDDLLVFCAAVELGSVSRAARKLGLSQPGASKRMSHLERAWGIALLERTAGGVAPTPAGAGVYREARRLLTQAELLAAILRSPGRP